MYQEVILQHYRAPHGRGVPAEAGALVGGRKNPLCGDDITLGVVLRGEVIEQVGFEGRGCSITIASASMLTDAVRGRNVGEALALRARVEQLLNGAVVPTADLAGDLRALSGVARYPQRVGCARMPWQVLTDVLAGR
jgi:nitrogen fixation NifU-like protein